MKTLITGSKSEKHPTAAPHAKNSMQGTLVNSVDSPLFLSDEEIDKIREHIRRKHRTNTNRLLIFYGLLLIVVIFVLSNYEIFR